VTAHRKNGTGAARPVLSLGTRKPRAASGRQNALQSAPAAGAKGAPTIKVKRTARSAAERPSEEHRPEHRKPRRLAPAAVGGTPPPAALKKRRAASRTPAATPAAGARAAAVPVPAPIPAPVQESADPAILTAPALSERQLRHLRGLAHALKPLVRLGSAGLTPAVAKETARALADHELIKVKAQAPDRHGRDALLTELARLTGSALVHRIGHIGVLYRPRPGLSKILIPD